MNATILRALLKDGRRDFQEIAEEIGTSKNAVWKHYKEMTKSGVIVGATAHINREHMGLQVVAEIHINDFSMSRIQIHEKLRKNTGDILFLDNPLEGNIIILAFPKNLRELERIKQTIAQFNIGRISSYVWTPATKNIPENLSFGLPKRSEAETPEKEPNPAKSNGNRAGKVDEKDTQIIERLIQNGRMPFRKISKEIGITTDTVARRYKKLRRNGTIKPVIQINPRKIGYHCTLISRIWLKTQKDPYTTMNALAKIPDVFCLVATTGDHDLLIWALIRDIEHLLQIQNEIANVPDFRKMNSQTTIQFMDAYPGPRQFVTTI